ncbi:MAG: MoxR family ATPase [Verrucomicrobiota bacterium]|jgi:MoxR-like ATPase|nr:MoxR family ATPase [Verrucomicrobiota bacterium]MEE2813305.1 MoxR family ATPase [Verrucomicrobiota bacterium]
MHSYILFDADAPGAGGGTPLTDDDKSAVDQLRGQYDAMRIELAKVIIGQDQVVDEMLMCILSRGHGLLMGVPGLAKTLMVNSLSKIMSLGFSRIQFTPDLMPSDITGTEILQEGDTGRRQFEFVKGPIFSNIILADEINRTPPKTQSALLEAMQEHRVTTAGEHRELPQPFFVLATQNPIEQEGTYPLPEAQLDRFMFLITVDYPSVEEERRIARETTGGSSSDLAEVIDGPTLQRYQSLVERVPVPDHVYDGVVDMVRMTRPKSDDAPEWVKKWVTWGSGPRAVQYLVRGAKANAVLHGRYVVGWEDVEAVAQPVLSHRILTNFQAQSEGVDSIFVIEKLLENIREKSEALAGE